MMEVQILAESVIYSFLPEYRRHQTYPLVTDADNLAEMAGRLCYKSWDRPNPETATNKGYLANIIEHGHFSVLEHASVTFYISGVSRTLTHELVRHRHLSFSQVSQRYVAEDGTDIIIPFALGGGKNKKLRKKLKDLDKHAKYVYNHIYAELSKRGLPKKEARQAARSALLGSQGTEIIVTGNLRAWREVVAKRNSPHADKEIQGLAKELLVLLKEVAPNSFQDMN